MDRYTEADDDPEVDVDVEQCSDSEMQSRTNRTSRNSRASPASPCDDDRLSPEPAQVCRSRWMVLFKEENH